MSEQDGAQATALQRPTNDDKDEWQSYWKSQGQDWRTEIEIDIQRQVYLAQQRLITPNVKQGIYPFKGIKLCRADVEWLLATHESGGLHGPVDWSDESQRNREGLDLRGADLSQVDLSGLPLACMQGGLKVEEWFRVIRFGGTKEQGNMAAVSMQQANLIRVQLQGARFWGARLQHANLEEAQMQQASLVEAQLQGAFLWEAQLQGADLREAQLQQANLEQAQLQGADLRRAQLQGADLREAQLDGVDLREAILSDKKYASVLLADIRWGEINLAVVDWTPVKMLGDEQLAHQRKAADDYRAAVRANRQLTVVLRNQGLNEEADHFAYRAQLLQKVVWRRQRKILKYLLSWFLSLIAGYGYRPFRSIIIYLLVVFGFAVGYYQGWSHYHLEHITKHSLSFVGAVIFSITAFHGRGFFLGGELGYDSLITLLGAVEAIIGLLIELSFIATFTQRFFGR